jgi:hypothetical protein
LARSSTLGSDVKITRRTKDPSITSGNHQSQSQPKSKEGKTTRIPLDTQHHASKYEKEAEKIGELAAGNLRESRKLKEHPY